MLNSKGLAGVIEVRKGNCRSTMDYRTETFPNDGAHSRFSGMPPAEIALEGVSSVFRRVLQITAQE